MVSRSMMACLSEGFKASLLRPIKTRALGNVAPGFAPTHADMLRPLAGRREVVKQQCRAGQNRWRMGPCKARVCS